MKIKEYLLDKIFTKIFNLRNATIPNILLDINEKYNLHKYLSPIYTQYLRLRYEDNYIYWFNHLFANDIILNKQTFAFKVNYSHLLFALFGHDLFNDTIIYHKYGQRFLNTIDCMYSHDEQFLILIIYLWHFTPIMEINDLTNVLNKLIKSLNTNPNRWKVERFSNYYYSLINDSKFQSIDESLRIKLEASLFIEYLSL